MKLFVRDKHFYNTFFRLTLTIALQNVIVFGVNLADNVMLGAFSQDALSGAAVVNQIQYLLQMLIFGVGESALILSARSWGKRETDPIRKLAGISMATALVIAFAMWATAFFAPEWVLSLFTSDPAVITEGVKYLQIVCFSYVFFAVTNILIYTMRSVETVKIGFLCHCRRCVSMYASTISLFTAILARRGSEFKVRPLRH